MPEKAIFQVTAELRKQLKISLLEAQIQSYQEQANIAFQNNNQQQAFTCGIVIKILKHELFKIKCPHTENNNQEAVCSCC